LASWSAHFIGAAGGLVLARSLQPEGKGVYSLLFLAGILAGAVMTFGTDLWSTKEASRSGITAEVAGIVRRHLQMITSVSLVAFVVYGATHLIVTDRVPPPEAFAVFLLAVTSCWSVSLAGLLRGTRQMKALLQMQLIAPLVFVAGIAVWAAVSEPTVAGALWLAVAGRVASIARGPWRSVLAGEPVERRRWFRVLRSHVSSSVGVLVEFASYRVDVLFIAVFLTTTEVGLYSVALPLSELLWLLPNGLAQVLLPHVAASTSGTASSTAAAIRLTLGFSVVGAGVLVALAAPVIETLYGEEYLGAAAALPLLALGAVILSAWKLVTADLLARGDSSIRARGGLLAIAVLAVSVAPLTASFGLAGAAGSTALAYSAAASHGLSRWRRLPGAHLGDLVPGRMADIALVARLTRSGTQALVHAATRSGGALR
jgi:O-antigen/teichoic acid export membrane protein